MFRILFALLFTLSLNAYTIPTFELLKSNEAEILIFKARTVLVKNTFSYIIEWKSVNATDVNLSLVGEVEASGEIVISEEEYYRDNITLTVSNKDSKDIRKLYTYKEKYIKPKSLPSKNDVNYASGFLEFIIYVVLNTIASGVNQ